MVRLRVTSPFLAVQFQNDKGTFYTLAVGSIIATGNDLSEPVLVRISFHGQELLAFARDIKEHTESLDFIVENRSSEDESKTASPRQRHRHRVHGRR